MPPLPRPRLATLHLFSSALLASIGAGCGGIVVFEEAGEDGGDGGGGANGGSSGSGRTTSVQGPSASVQATSVGSSGTSGGATSSVNSAVGATASVGVSTSSSAVATSTGVGGGPAGCDDPQPHLVDGNDTGFDRCSGGQLRRREVLTCPTSWPDDNPCCGEDGCGEGYLCSDFGEVACGCVPACTTDSDCGPGALCLCGDPAGTCVQASCTSADDCGEGQECTSWDVSLGCLYIDFSCTTAADSCGGDLDCGGDTAYCAVDPGTGVRSCVSGGCDIGRPFLIDDEARTAALAARTDWRDGALVPSVEGLGDDRGEIAGAWEHVALMEHASIAAFARFALELLALGAPPELVERTHRAMADETRHARAAFAIAGAYRGRPLGPGALAIDGALTPTVDPGDVLRRLVREGCVGETIAALEAGEAAARAEDAVIAAVLDGIAADETEHAALAWHAARWILEAFPASARAALHDELGRIDAELARVPAASPPTARDERLLDRGVVTTSVRARMRAPVLRSAVRPAIVALLWTAHTKGEGHTDPEEGQSARVTASTRAPG